MAAEPTTVLWVTALGEGAPLVAALVVSGVLARSGFRDKINEYREDTLLLVQMRAETVEKQLAEARTRIEELRQEIRGKERYIGHLEEQVGQRHVPERAAAGWADEDTP